MINFIRNCQYKLILQNKPPSGGLGVGTVGSGIRLGVETADNGILSALSYVLHSSNSRQHRHPSHRQGRRYGFGYPDGRRHDPTSWDRGLRPVHYRHFFPPVLRYPGGFRADPHPDADDCQRGGGRGQADRQHLHSAPHLRPRLLRRGGPASPWPSRIRRSSGWPLPSGPSPSCSCP